MLARYGALLSVVLAGAALGDGLETGPDGYPRGVVWLALDGAQSTQAKQTLADERQTYVELELTPAQQDAVERAFGVRARWMGASLLKVLLSDCTCGSLNIAVLEPARIGVIPGYVSLAMSLKEYRALRGPSPSDPAPAERTPRGPLQSIVRAEAQEQNVAWLQAALPVRTFSRTVELAAGWQAASLDTGRTQRASGSLLELLPVRLAEVKRAAAPGAHAEWPQVGAVLERGTETFLLLPGAEDHESEGWFATWMLARYEGGRLSSVLVLREAHDHRTLVGFEQTAAGLAAAWGRDIDPRAP